VGDTLVLREWSPTTAEFSGRELTVGVTYKLDGPGFGVPEGLCILSLNMMGIVATVRPR
jgi:hypothetical protein